MASGGRGACWIVITNNEKYAFVTNSLSTFPPGDGEGRQSSRYAVGRDGSLKLLGQTDVSPSTSTPGAAFPTDETLSSDSRYLYVVSPTLAGCRRRTTATRATSTSTRVGHDGSLTHIQTTPATLPAGASGLAAS